MPISADMIVRVAHADVALHMAFQSSVRHWQRPKEGDNTWKVLPGHCERILIGSRQGVVIDGDCSNDVSAPDGGFIHIYGGLAARIDANSLHEIVITGDVGPDAVIQASGFCHVFVGGAFSGVLDAQGSTKLWIGGDFRGTIKTGNPSTEIHIERDFLGTIVPNEKAALLYLIVDGFASEKSLAGIAECGYVQFEASVGQSDVEPGLYPIHSYHRKTSRGNSYNRWCVVAKSTSVTIE